MTLSEPYIEFRNRWFVLRKKYKEEQPIWRHNQEIVNEMCNIVLYLKGYGYYLDWHTPTSGNNYNSEPFFYKIISGSIEIFEEGS